MKTIYLLTGAAGLLGNNVALSLISESKQVRALVLDGDPAAEHVPKESEIVIGDVTDIPSLERFFTVTEGIEVIVIHCASIVSVSPLPSQKVYDVNVTGTQNIVDLCVANKVKKLVYISSSGAIPELPGGQTIYEPESFDTEVVVGYYSKTKALATQIVLKAVKENGLDASIIYPSGICGPNDYAFGPVAGVIMQYCDGKMPVGFEGSFNSVDVRDLAEGVVACAEKGRRGEGYIMSNEMVTIRRLFDLISTTSGSPVVDTILSADDMIAMSAKNIPEGPEKEEKLATLKFSMYNMVRNNNFSSEKAQKELGYHTRPFEETITDEVNWLISIGKVKKQSVYNGKPMTNGQPQAIERR